MKQQLQFIWWRIESLQWPNKCSISEVCYEKGNCLCMYAWNSATNIINPLNWHYFIHLFLIDNCFTILCWFPSYISIYPLCLKPLSDLQPHPTPLDCLRAPDLSSLCHTANFHWVYNFSYGNVHVSMLLSQFVPPSPSPSVPSSLFSTSASPLLPCK